MTIVIILFFIVPADAFSQCKKQVILHQSGTLEGTANGIDNYYHNLIIQDLALASQKAFLEISIPINYEIQYVTDQCRQGQIEIRVLPVVLQCSPLFYQGYDISSSIRPEKADLVFHLIHPDGFVSDSLIFFDIPLNKDSSLYTSMNSNNNNIDAVINVSYSRAVLHYTKSSYELFRDNILEIDRYYAASLIADSTGIWADDGFLSENGTNAELILRQIELERILNYIRPQQFKSVYSRGKFDLDGLTSKFEELHRTNNRLKAIIRYNLSTPEGKEGAIHAAELLNSYLNWFDHYYHLAYNTDFRYMNYIEGLAAPVFTNAKLAGIYQLLVIDLGVHRPMMHYWGKLLVQGFIERGTSFEQKGNQLRALTYYKSAFDLSERLNLQDYNSTAMLNAGRMKDSISGSYLEISRKSALTGNPNMAARYNFQAKGLFEDEDFQSAEPDWLREYERWLYRDFEMQAVKNINLKDYNKALAYLNEIQFHCMSAITYPCPELFHDWMRTTREGIYFDLLQMAKNLLAREETLEAGQKFRQAVALRMGAGYRINKDVKETELELRFRQIQCDELYDEGLRFFEKEEFSSALYFFNKAEYLERSGLIRSQPQLDEYRQAAVRQVILQNLSEGRVKAWAHDFEGAGTILNLLTDLLSDYQITENDSLYSQYLALEESVSRKKCEKIFNQYAALMSAADTAKVDNDFILAHKLVCDAVNLSMDHLDCGIRDDDAWYQKVMLEAPAEFQGMENELKDHVLISYSNYLNGFQELRRYYNRHKLLQQGVVFVPLIDRVVQEQDSVFLYGMLGHYLKLKDYNNSFRLLARLNELGFPSGTLTEEQIMIAGYVAGRDAMDITITKPWETLQSYTGQDKWYRSFNRGYKHAWLKATHWKLKYWPFIWKK